MNEVNERELAEQIHRELNQLPNLKAPSSLGPRVLAAIAARQEVPLWKKSWTDWPIGMKALFLVMGIAALGGLVMAGSAVPQLSSLASGVMDSFANMFAAARPYFEPFARLSGSIAPTLEAAGPKLFWYLAALVGIAYATCIALGTLGYRLVFNKI